MNNDANTKINNFEEVGEVISKNYQRDEVTPTSSGITGARVRVNYQNQGPESRPFAEEQDDRGNREVKLAIDTDCIISNHYGERNVFVDGNGLEDQDVSMPRAENTLDLSALLPYVGDLDIHLSYRGRRIMLLEKMEFIPTMPKFKSKRSYAYYGKLSFLAEEPVMSGFDYSVQRARPLQKVHYFVVGPRNFICHLVTGESTCALHLKVLDTVAAYESQMLSAVQHGLSKAIVGDAGEAAAEAAPRVAASAEKAASAAQEVAESITRVVDNITDEDLKEFAKTAKTVNETCKRVNKIMDGVSHSFQRTSKSWNIHGMFGSLSEKVRQFFAREDVKVAAELITVVICSCLLIKVVQYINTCTMALARKFLAHFSACMLAIGVFYPAFSIFAKLLQKLIPGSDTTAPPENSEQGEEEDEKVEYVPQIGAKTMGSLLASLVSVAFGFGTFLGNPSEFSFTDTLKKLRAHANGFYTIEQAIEALTYAFPEKYRLALYDRFGIGISTDIRWADKAAIAAAFAVVKVVDSTHANKIRPEMKREFLERRREMMDLVAKYSVTANDKFVVSVINDVLRKMNKLTAKVQSVADHSSIKLEPFGLWFYGPSGVGKTMVVDSLANTIFADKLPADRCYADNVADQYSSGYKGQSLYYMDDVGTKPQALEESNTFPQMMTWMSCFRSVMNKAFSKDTYFSSHGVVLTSNACPKGIIHTQNLTNGEAVRRRFTNGCGLCIYMEPKPAFSRRDSEGFIIGDKDAINAMAEEDPNKSKLFAHVNFYVTDGQAFSRKRHVKPGTPNCRPLTFHQLCNEVAQIYLRNLKSFRTALSTSKEFGDLLDQNTRMKISEAIEAIPAYELEPQMDEPKPGVERKLPPDGDDYVEDEPMNFERKLDVCETCAFRPDEETRDFTRPYEKNHLPELTSSPNFSTPEHIDEWFSRVIDNLSSYPTVFWNTTFVPNSTPKKEIDGRFTYSELVDAVKRWLPERSVDDTDYFENIRQRLDRLGIDYKKVKGMAHHTPYEVICERRTASGRFNPRDVFAALERTFSTPGELYKRQANHKKLSFKEAMFTAYRTYDASEITPLKEIFPPSSPKTKCASHKMVAAFLKMYIETVWYFAAEGTHYEGFYQHMMHEQLTHVYSFATARACCEVIKNTIEDRWTSLRKWWDEFCGERVGLKHYATAIAAIGLFGSIAVGIRHFFQASETYENESWDPKRDRLNSRRGKRHHRRVGLSMGYRDAYPGFSHSWETQSAPHRKITPATFPFQQVLVNSQLTISYSHGGHSYNGSAWRYGNTIMFNRHFFITARERLEPEVLVNYRGQTFALKFRWKDVFEIYNDDGTPSDIALWKTPTYTNQAMPLGPKISRHFVDSEELVGHFGGQNAIGGKMSFLVDSKERVALDGHAVLQRFPKGARFKEGHAKIHSSQCYRYEHPTAAGDCGKLLSDGQKLYGVHMVGERVGGIVRAGFSQVITRSMLTSAVATMETQNEVFLCDNVSSYDFEGFQYTHWDQDLKDVPRGFIPVGFIAERAGLPQGTKMVRTLLDSPLPASCERVPAPLNKHQAPLSMQLKTKSFMAQLQKKFSVRPMDLPSFQHRTAMVGLVDSIPNRFHAGVLSLDEAMNPKFEGCMKALPRATSAGHLWKLKGGRRGKSHVVLFDEIAEHYHPAPELKEHFEFKVGLLETGHMPYFVFSSFPKDELLSKEKIARVGAREITCSQVDFSYLVRRYFGVFSANFVVSSLNWGHAVGLEVMGPGWDAMMKQMLSVSDVGFDSDVRSFDSTMGAQFFLTFADVVDNWYKRYDPDWRVEHRRARFLLMYATVFNWTVIGRTVSQSLMGNISGQPLTTLHNTFARRILGIVSYIDIMNANKESYKEDPDVYTVQGFPGYREYVRAFGLGDDSIDAISPAVIEHYNFNSVAKYLKQYGVLVTPADKDTKAPEPFKSLLDCSFLSCTTRVDEELLEGISYYPHLKQASLAKCVAYVRPNADLDEVEALQDNINTTLGLAWFMGKEKFTDIRDELIVEFQDKYKQGGHFLSYEDIYTRVSGKKYPQPVIMETQGLTISTSKVANHVQGLVDSTFQANPHNSIEAATDVDAKANMDAPNLGQHTGGIVRAAMPHFGSAQGVSFAQPMAITQELEKTLQTPFNDIDDLAYARFARLTHSDSFTIDTSQDTSVVVAEYALCPNQSLVGAVLGSVNEVSSLCYLSAQHGFWRGCLRHSFHFVANAVSTCRVGIGVLYDVDTTVGLTFEEKLGQVYTIVDINSGSNVVVLDVPYVAPTELLETYNGQTDPKEYSMGVIFMMVLNAYRSPPSGAQSFDVVHFEGAGQDFELYSPFASNATLVPYVPGDDEERKAVYEVQMDLPDVGGRRVASADSGIEDVITMKTKAYVPAGRSNPIVRTPQSLRCLARRFYNVGFYTATELSNGIVYEHGRFATLGDTSARRPYTGLNIITAPFAMWTGSMVYRFTCRTDFAVTYRAKMMSGTHPGFTRYSSTVPPGRGPSLPLSVGETTVGYVDIIVPFSSKFNACKMALNVTDTSEEYMPGDLIFNGLPGVPSQEVNIFLSGGDGFNFGTPCLLPQYQLTATNVFPDNYPSPPSSGRAPSGCIYETQMDDPEKVGIDSDEKVGAIMVENAGVTTTLAQASVVNEQKYIAQPSLSFEDYMKRPQLAHVFKWYTADTVGTPKYGGNVPLQLTTNTSAKAVAAFRLLRCDMAITVKLNATPFHAGRLICAFYPLQPDGSTNPTRASKTFCPHMFIDAQSSTSNTLVIPYRYFKPFMTIRNNDSFGHLEISVFTALRTGTGSATSLDVTVFSSFPQSHLRVINQDV
jgi:hypothetical protein